VTVFWGRNKKGACDTGRYTTVIVSFLGVYSDGTYHLDLSGHPLGRVGGDIKHCQSKGVPVSLAIVADEEVGAGAVRLSLERLLRWVQEGRAPPVRRRRGLLPRARHAVLARELAKHNIRGGPGKLLHLTATPRCAFPDDRVKKALDTGIFERIHVRFYDDPHCRSYWQEEWQNWTAAYPHTNIYFGLTASPEAGEGYVFPREIYYSLLTFAQTVANFGGVMLWDRYHDKLNALSSFVTGWA
jgi:chitinase